VAGLSQETLPETEIVAIEKAFRYAMEAYEMFESGESGDGGEKKEGPEPEVPESQKERLVIDREIHRYVVENRPDIAGLLSEEDDGRKLASLHYLRLAELGFRAILARGRVTPEEIEADKKRMLDELESYKPEAGELDDQQMRDWLDVQKGLAMRFAGEIEPDEIAKEINKEYEAAERLASVVKKMLETRSNGRTID